MVYRMIIAASHVIDWMGLAAFVAALSTFFVAVIGAGTAAYVSIKKELREAKQLAEIAAAQTQTVNGKSIAELAEASETRRITRIPAENRTDEEVSHLKTVPPPYRPNTTDGVLPTETVVESMTVQEMTVKKVDPILPIPPIPPTTIDIQPPSQ